MKKITYILVGLIVACLIFAGVALVLNNQRTPNAEGAYPSGIKKVSCIHANNVTYSSTSPKYLLNTNASSSCVIDISHIKNLSLAIFLNSTTTDTSLHFFLAGSINDGIGVNTATTTDWYRFKINSDSGATRTWNTGSVTNVLPFSSSTIFSLIPITDLRSQFLRIDYGVTNAAANVAFEIYADTD